MSTLNPTHEEVETWKKRISEALPPEALKAKVAANLMSLALEQQIDGLRIVSAELVQLREFRHNMERQLGLAGVTLVGPELDSALARPPTVQTFGRPRLQLVANPTKGATP